MIIKTVRYGRTVELGKFGRGPHERVWFGWEAEPQEGESEEDVMVKLHHLADDQEVIERRLFAEKHGLQG